MRLNNEFLWKDIIKNSITYLANLKDASHVPLLQHRRKTFVLGFITSALSTQGLALYLLNKSTNPFSYVLPYKFSQDHLELLFSCIRGKNGFNNNPDVRTFVSAIKRVLLRVSVIASRHANCLAFEDEASTQLFSLKWSKNRAPIDTGSNDVDVCGEEDREIHNHILQLDNESNDYKDAIFGYIGGYVVCQLLKKLTCQECSHALTTNVEESFLSLTKLKDRGGLYYPSIDAIKIIRTG